MIIFSTSSQVIKTGEQTIKMRLRKPERKYKPLLNKPNKNPENKIPSKNKIPSNNSIKTKKKKNSFFFSCFHNEKKNPFFNQFSGQKDLRGEKIRLRQCVTRKNKFLLKKINSPDKAKILKKKIFRKKEENRGKKNILNKIP